MGFGIVSESSKPAANPRSTSTRLDLQSPLAFPFRPKDKARVENQVPYVRESWLVDDEDGA
jgi:hypothetical protein